MRGYGLVNAVCDNFSQPFSNARTIQLVVENIKESSQFFKQYFVVSSLGNLQAFT